MLTSAVVERARGVCIYFDNRYCYGIFLVKCIGKAGKCGVLRSDVRLKQAKILGAEFGSPIRIRLHLNSPRGSRSVRREGGWRKA